MSNFLLNPVLLRQEKGRRRLIIAKWGQKYRFPTQPLLTPKRQGSIIAEWKWGFQLPTRLSLIPPWLKGIGVPSGTAHYIAPTDIMVGGGGRVWSCYLGQWWKSWLSSRHPLIPPHWQGGMPCYCQVRVEVQASQGVSTDTIVDGDGFSTAQCSRWVSRIPTRHSLTLSQKRCWET